MRWNMKFFLFKRKLMKVKIYSWNNYFGKQCWFLDDETIPKKLAGKGWRNSVIQRRIYGRLTKSAKKEAEEWARQTKRTLGSFYEHIVLKRIDLFVVMELIKQRKHTWISRPKRQVKKITTHFLWNNCAFSKLMSK